MSQQFDLSQSEEPVERKTAPAPEITVSTSDDDEDDTMSYFAKLAAEEQG